jgi:hypothetical protein
MTATGNISADMSAVAGPLSFWRITHVPFAAWLGRPGTLATDRGRQRTALRQQPTARAGRTRPALRHLPDRGPPGPRSAAPAAAHAARHRPLVRHLDRTHAHPVPAGTAGHRLLPGRAPPAGLPDLRCRHTCQHSSPSAEPAHTSHPPIWAPPSRGQAEDPRRLPARTRTGLQAHKLAAHRQPGFALWAWAWASGMAKRGRSDWPVAERVRVHETADDEDRRPGPGSDDLGTRAPGCGGGP